MREGYLWHTSYAFESQEIAIAHAIELKDITTTNAIIVVYDTFTNETIRV